MARPKAVCPSCYLPPDECLGHDDDDAPPDVPVRGPAAASGLTVLYCRIEGADAGPGEPDEGLYRIDD